MQGLRSWAWPPKVLQNFGVLCEGSSVLQNSGASAKITPDLFCFSLLSSVKASFVYVVKRDQFLRREFCTSGKRILDARILNPNSWVTFIDPLFAKQKKPPEKFTLEKFTSQNSPSKIQPRNRASKFIITPLQGHLADVFGWIKTGFHRLTPKSEPEFRTEIPLGFFSLPATVGLAQSPAISATEWLRARSQPPWSLRFCDAHFVLLTLRCDTMLGANLSVRFFFGGARFRN